MKEIISDLKKVSSKKQAKVLKSFFKTGEGHYGEGDVFLGCYVPDVRVVAKSHFAKAALSDIHNLLDINLHEVRLCALLMLIQKYQISVSLDEKKEFCDFYLSHTKAVNNWDLVDLSAEKIVGQYFFETNTVCNNHKLTKFASSNYIWDRRIAVLATFAFIKNNSFDETFRLAKMLLDDKHDLMHKCVGWMLREVGKRDQAAEEEFLRAHYKKMPRTMLRYAIERFSPSKRKAYLEGRI
ncbi:MAG: DNA alkylation repair protein [archaeon]